MTNVKTSLAWSFSERYLSQIVTLISSMFLARLLTPEQIGIYSLCAAVTAMATIFRDFGVSEYIIQEKELTKDKLKGAYALAFLMAWVMAIILFFSKDFIADFYNEEGVSEIITVLCVNFLILPLASPGFAILNREMAFNKIFIVQLPSTFIQALVGVLLAYKGFSYMSLAWASFAGIVTQTILITILRPRESLILPSFKQMKFVWKFGMTFSLSRTIEVMMGNIHELIISHQFGFAQLGMFSRAQGLINLFWVNVTSAVARVAAPSFAKSYHQSPDNLVLDYRKALSYFTVVAWPFFGFIAIESDSIIYILFGEQWLPAAPIASILACTQLVSSIVSFAPNALIAMGKVKQRLWITLLLAPIHILGIVIASSFNILWVASIWGLTSLVGLIAYNYYLSLTLKFHYQCLFETIKPSLWVAMASVFPVLLVRMLVNDYLDSMLIGFIISCIVIIVMWGGAIFVVKHPVSKDIKDILNFQNKIKSLR